MDVGLPVFTPVAAQAAMRPPSGRVEDCVNATTDAEILTGLVEAAPDALIVVDDEGRIVLWNAEAETMFGWRRDEILGHRIEDLVPERFRRAHVAHRAEYRSVCGITHRVPWRKGALALAKLCF